jgi:hypothetical protein
MAAVTLRCQACGSEFLAARQHARWCSDRCRMAYSRRRLDYPEDLPRLAWLETGRDAELGLCAFLRVIWRIEDGKRAA